MQFCYCSEPHHDTPQACVMLTHTTLHTAHCTSTFALLPCLLCLCSTYCIFMFYVMCNTYCVCMFLCLLYAPIHQNKFQVGVNLLGNKYYSDSDSDMLSTLGKGWQVWEGQINMLKVYC